MRVHFCLAIPMCGESPLQWGTENDNADEHSE
jgi:hypothetical protein